MSTPPLLRPRDHKGGSGLSGGVRPMVVPHRCQACHTRRRSAAGCTPGARATSPNRPARTYQSHRLHPNRPRIGPPRPATLQATRPAGGAWPSRRRCRPTPPPRPPLRAGARWLCRARRGWPRGGWHRRALRRGRARGVGGRRPGRVGGRVAGKPGQHRRDRLGLLLCKEAAGLTAHKLHLVGEPWRRPSSPAATLPGGGLACRWRRPRIGVVHARLLARPTAAGADGRGEESCTRSQFCLDHANQGVRASRVSRRPTSVRTDDDPAPRLHSARVAVHGPRHSGPANPQMILARLRGWLGSPRSQAARARRNRPISAVVAAHRFDHALIIGRSRGHRLVHRSITRHSAAPQPPAKTTGCGAATAARRAAPLRPARREPLVPRRTPPVGQPGEP
jgi:hypothetical protein